MGQPHGLEALHQTTWYNHSLFLDKEVLLVEHLKTDTFDAVLADMAQSEVTTGWQLEMALFFERGERADGSLMRLEEVFHLDTATGETDTTTSKRT